MYTQTHVKTKETSNIRTSDNFPLNFSVKTWRLLLGYILSLLLLPAENKFVSRKSMQYFSPSELQYQAGRAKKIRRNNLPRFLFHRRFGKYKGKKRKERKPYWLIFFSMALFPAECLIERMGDLSMAECQNIVSSIDVT